MSDIRTIRQQLKPWPSYDNPLRYYVNDWTDRIWSELQGYRNRTPRSPDMGLLKKVGKVWYDPSGRVHVEGIYDQFLSAYIARVMTETQFLDDEYDPSIGAREVDWTSLVDKVPYEILDGAYHFHHGDREYIVDTEFYGMERITNRAYRSFDGTVHFESEAIDLQELVLQLIADDYECGRPDEILTELIQCFGTELDANDPCNPNTVLATPIFEQDSPMESKSSSHVRDTGQRRSATREGTMDLGIFVHTIPIEESERQQAIEKALPISRWTKSEVLETCELARVPEASMDAIRRMTLDDIRATCLRYDSTGITGNDYNSLQQRHTRFLRLDIDRIESLGKE